MGCVWARLGDTKIPLPQPWLQAPGQTREETSKLIAPECTGQTSGQLNCEEDTGALRPPSTHRGVPRTSALTLILENRKLKLTEAGEGLCL